MAGRFATQFITIFLLCINTAINITRHHHSQYPSIADQTTGPTVSLQASASNCHAIALSTQLTLFQLHVQNFKAHNRNCNTFLSTLLLTLSADINHNPGPEVSLHQHSYDTTEILPTYYPCGCCTKEVSWGDRTVNCDVCYRLYHVG